MHRSLCVEHAAGITSDEDVLSMWFPGVGRRFIMEYYITRLPIVVHGDANRFGLDARAFDDVERLIRIAPAEPLLTVYLPDADLGTQQIVTDPRSAALFFKRGCTVSIEGAAMPRVVSLGSALSSALGALSAPPATIVSQVGEAVPAHFDGVDSVVLMMRGRKRWTIAPNEVLFPNQSYFPTMRGTGLRGRRSSASDQSVPHENKMRADRADTFELSAGSVAFVPRGWWHKTECMEESVSFTFRVSNSTVGAALVKRLCRMLEDDPRWRASLLLSANPRYRDQATPRIEDALICLRAAVERLTAADVMGAQLGTYYRRTAECVIERISGKDGSLSLAVRLACGEGPGATFDRAALPVLQWMTQVNGFFESDLRQRCPGWPASELRKLLDSVVDCGVLSAAVFRT
jgi:hypothetical protein